MMSLWSKVESFHSNHRVIEIYTEAFRVAHWEMSRKVLNSESIHYCRHKTAVLILIPADKHFHFTSAGFLAGPSFLLDRLWVLNLPIEPTGIQFEME